MAKHLGLLAGAAGAVGVAFSSVNKAMDFESQMSTIKALTGATNEQMAQMQKLALDMGAKTKYSALEAAKGIEELLKAGITPATVKAGGLEAALNLATAGGLDLAEAAEIMSTSLNSFSKDGMKASDAANILAGTANASATDVHDLKYSLSAVAAVASGAGLSMKDTSIALGVLANKGLKGSDAGTSLKSMLLQLQPTTKKTAKLFEVLGLETEKNGNAFYDAKGNIKSMADIAQVLHDKFKNLTSGERQAAFKEAFGTDAIRAANILYEAGAKGVKKFQTEMSKVTALDVAKQKMNNASGAVEQFKGALETLQISVLLPLMPVIKDAANKFADWVAKLKPEQIKSWGDKIKEVGQKALDLATTIHDNWGPIKETIIGITAAVVTFKFAMAALMIVQTINKLMAAYRAGTLLATIAQWDFNAALFANPIGLVILALAALVGIIVVVVRNWETVKAKTVEFWNTIKNNPIAWLVAGPLMALITAAVKLYQNWDTVKIKFGQVWDSIKSGAASAVNTVISGINAMIRVINKIPGVNVPIVPKVYWGNTKVDNGGEGVGGTGAVSGAYLHARNSRVSATKASNSGPVFGRFASGLSNVPYNGFLASLHKGERILTPEENQAYNGRKGSFNFYGDINIHGVGGDIENAADKLMEIIANKVEAAGGAGA
ncbi:phage tail tape measure protein [Neobacillus niacini]|uniref:phage tail tape measure protein n=1 Tax=Neobacillus niacini TaxID=86668 RepID=UPI00285BBC08|nr:phage tail tape measure protein [Neobacillus niacini]MDR7001558.1 TP901 family phage tail tape measure protein [Neobacillus niacini]